MTTTPDEQDPTVWIESAQDAAEQLRGLIREAHETMRDYKDAQHSLTETAKIFNAKVLEIQGQVPEYVDAFVIPEIQAALDKITNTMDDIEQRTRDRVTHLTELLINPSIRGVSMEELALGGQLVVWIAEDEELSKTFKKLMRERIMRQGMKTEYIEEDLEAFDRNPGDTYTFGPAILPEPE